MTGEDKFIDSIGDGEGNMTTGSVAVEDRASVVAGESETIAVLDNDFHTEGLLFGVTSFEGQTENGGTVTRDDNGTAHLMDDKLVYTPAAGFTGEDSFIYSIGDAEGNMATATVTVTVESAPLPGAVAVEDRASVDA
ncbi:MAG: cadherin-like domain-containing protein [Hormoscilla sp. GM7CHS1pb]|nr:cadherin-like domain-containing protein [Hormoscilla sp. GM7CHS1pb]